MLIVKSRNGHLKYYLPFSLCFTIISIKGKRGYIYLEYFLTSSMSYL